MKRQPKILNLIEVPLDSLGGSQRTARDLDSVLTHAGFDVTTICPEKYSRLRPQVLETVAGPLYRWRISASLVRPRLAGADLLIANNGAAWGLRFVPTLRIWQNEHFEYGIWTWPRWHPNYYRLKFVDVAIERSAARHCINYTVSDRMASYLDKNAGIEVRGVVENAVDTSHFAPLGAEAGDDFRRRHGLPPRPSLLLLYVGRPARAKGLALLAEWATRFDSSLSIVLAGPDSVPKQFKGARNVYALGMIDYADLPALYASADFLGHPSYAEGCSYAVMEAMSCGLPCLLTDAGHVQSIAKRCGELGRWIASTSNPHVLTDHLEQWLSHPEILPRVGEASRGYTLEYHTMDRFEREWARVVEDILEESSERNPD